MSVAIFFLPPIMLSKQQLIKQFYRDFKTTKENKDIIKDEELYQLYKQQFEPREAQGHFFAPKPGFKAQADLLFLPNDQGYKYLLVVVDISDRKVDFEPIKSKRAGDIIQAFNTIFERQIVMQPQIYIGVDAGKEFDNIQLKGFLKSKDIYLKIAKPGRHRQQAIVERTNKTIGTMIYKYITAQKLASNESQTGWIHKLDLLRKILNIGKKPPSKGDILQSKFGELRLTKINSLLLPEGTRVRVKLDVPTDIFGARLGGNKRSGDIKFGRTIHTITQIELIPNMPPFYKIDNDDTVRYTREQLLPIDEELLRKPPIKKVRIIEGSETITKFVVEKILDRRKEPNRTISYLVKYKGYKKPEWNTRANLMKDVPELVKDFERSIH